MKHDGDCHIYASDYPFCDCGLLHRLKPEAEPWTLYPDWERDTQWQAAWRNRLPHPMPESGDFVVLGRNMR